VAKLAVLCKNSHFTRSKTMAEQQTNTMMGRLVEFQGQFDFLSTREKQWVIQNTVAAIAIMVNSIREVVSRESVSSLASLITYTFIILVDETKTVVKLVKEGKFDWSNDYISSKNFPKLAEGRKTLRETVIFHFGKSISSKQVIVEMDKAGYRPATIWELLGLALKEPDLQRKFSIIALGSTCYFDDLYHVAFLYERSGGCRELSLCHFGNDWGADNRFLGVHK
jgi:hypothetical protein